MNEPVDVTEQAAMALRCISAASDDVTVKDAVLDALHHSKVAIEAYQAETYRLRALVATYHLNTGECIGGIRWEPSCSCGWKPLGLSSTVNQKTAYDLWRRHLDHTLETP